MARVYNDQQVTSFIDQFFRRFERLEAQLALVSEKLGVPFDYPAATVPAEVVELARSGDRLAAIKRYRELTNASSDEARDVVAGL
jgi:ribosomal protein L7/L12